MPASAPPRLGVSWSRGTTPDRSADEQRNVVVEVRARDQLTYAFSDVVLDRVQGDSPAPPRTSSTSGLEGLLRHEI